MKYLILLLLITSTVACKRSGISGVPGFKAEPALTGKSGKNSELAMEILGSSWEACIPYTDDIEPKCEKKQECGKCSFN